jgi:hypothetical protein
LSPVESLNAAIQGSKHDFSALSEKQEICVFCHTPHDANARVTEAPLWNRETSTKQFQLYNSPTLDAEVEQPSGTSKLCLSCHDGTVAIDSYGGNLGGKQVRSEAALAGDALQLANDHPISFVYDDSLAARDGELFARRVRRRAWAKRFARICCSTTGSSAVRATTSTTDRWRRMSMTTCW